MSWILTSSLFPRPTNSSAYFIKCLLSPYLNSIFGRVKSSGKEYSNSNYTKYYAVLGLPITSDQESVRKTFLKLAKKYHPDSGSGEANEEKFQEIETAYRKLQEKFAVERWRADEGSGEYGLYHKEKSDSNKEFDIKHTAPQHRQYLSFEGYGVGTQQQREKQYQKKRALTAVQNVYNHRISKVPQGQEQTLVIRDKQEAKKIKTRSDMERLVEDLIQESMARGDFDNLSGSGKPLKTRNNNPYVDFVTQKMNEVLIDNGFTPEWITLQKEIPREINDLREHMEQGRMLLGPQPLVGTEVDQWSRYLKNLEPRVLQLNRKITSFNLQVPLLSKQMIFFQLEKEAAKVLRAGKTKYDAALSQETNTQSERKPSNFVDLCEFILFGKS